MCVYSDSLDWVIDFTLHFMLRYIQNHGPVKLYNMQWLSDTLTLLLSKHYTDEGGIDCKTFYDLTNNSVVLYATYTGNNL